MTTKFGNLKMDEDKTISEYYTSSCDISIEAFCHERFFEVKLVRKVLRFLLEWFAFKVIAIEEAKDITTLRLDELICLLKTFELDLEEGKCHKVKGEKNVAFNIQSDVETEKQTREDINEIREQIALLSKNFNKALKRFLKKKL